MRLLWLADQTFDIVMFHVVLLLFASSALLGVVGIQITDLRVPAAVRNDSGTPALLDCEYSVKPEEEGLVVKWYFNNSPSPVYQWIPGKKPQDLGVLRGRLDLSYRASNHQLYMHRALYIRNPTTDLSGDYKCLVSTFNDEDFMVKRMIVFAAPQKDIVLTWRTSEVSNVVNLSCWTRDVYPQPKMFLYMESNIDEPLPDVQVMIVRKRNAFDISAHKLFDSREVIVPTIFHCELRIPEASYVTRKSLVFYPGVPFPMTDSAARIAWDVVKLLFIMAAATLC